MLLIMLKLWEYVTFRTGEVGSLMWGYNTDVMLSTYVIVRIWSFLTGILDSFHDSVVFKCQHFKPDCGENHPNGSGEGLENPLVIHIV